MAQFAADLRQLREAAGRPSYRELAARAHYSVTALSEAAGGERLPSLAVTLAYVRACGDADAWEARWQELNDEFLPSEVEEASPYRGLATFEPQDAELFFWRRAVVDDLCDRLAHTPFLAVFRPSGSGKSSVLRAGLLPAVWQGANDGAENWTTILLTPGPRPVEALAIGLANALDVTATSVHADLVARHDNALVLVRQSWKPDADRYR